MTDFERLHYAMLRLYVVAVYRPARALVAWLDGKMRP